MADGACPDRTEAYARFHAAESALRTEREKTASLEESLGKLLGEMQQKLPIYRDRSQRLSSALESHAELTTRLGAAVRESVAACKERDEATVALGAVRATLDELVQAQGVAASEVELREALHAAKLSADGKAVEAERCETRIEWMASLSVILVPCPRADAVLRRWQAAPRQARGRR